MWSTTVLWSVYFSISIFAGIFVCINLSIFNLQSALPVALARTPSHAHVMNRFFFFTSLSYQYIASKNNTGLRLSGWPVWR